VVYGVALNAECGMERDGHMQKKEKKQIYVSDARAGIDHCHRPVGWLRANKGVGSGVLTRKHRMQNNLLIVIPGNQTRTVRNMWSSKFIIAGYKQGGRCKGSRTRKGSPTGDVKACDLPLP
jgi:hypothetical protein